MKNYYYMEDELLIKKFINDPKTEKLFLKYLEEPKLKAKKDLLVKSESENYDTIDIAFNYLMRTYIQYLNPGLELNNNTSLKENMDIIPERYKSDAVVLNYLTTKLEHKYKDSMNISDYQITLYLQIAHYDIAFKSGSFQYFPVELGKVDYDDILIVRNMINLINPKEWTGLENVKSNTVDKDLPLIVSKSGDNMINGDTLIHIESSTSPNMTRDEFDHLFECYSLNYIDCLINSKESKIKKLGIYKGRYGEVLEFNIEDIISKEDYLPFLQDLLL